MLRVNGHHCICVTSEVTWKNIIICLQISKLSRRYQNREQKTNSNQQLKKKIRRAHSSISSNLMALTKKKSNEITMQQDWMALAGFPISWKMEFKCKSFFIFYVCFLFFLMMCCLHCKNRAAAEADDDGRVFVCVWFMEISMKTEHKMHRTIRVNALFHWGNYWFFRHSNGNVFHLLT